MADSASLTTNPGLAPARYRLRSGAALRRGAGLLLFFLPLLWTGCGDTRTAVQPTTVVPATPLQPATRAGDVVVEGAGATVGNDDYLLNTASIAGERLTVSVSYGGGCETHAFTLVIAASFIESSPVRLATVLAHEANDDECEAWLTRSYTFDLSIIRTRYREAYGPGAGRVVLQLDGVPDDDLVYEFTA